MPEKPSKAEKTRRRPTALPEQKTRKTQIFKLARAMNSHLPTAAKRKRKIPN
jgi:hypothetical protein